MSTPRTPIARLASGGQRAVGIALRPVVGATAAAAGVGLKLEQRAVERVVASSTVEAFVAELIESDEVQAALSRMLDSDGAKRLVARFFDSGLFDEVASGLLESRALWRLIDEIVASPAVTAAITQQGFGFADQVGEEIRTRSRSADDWLERAARRLTHRRQQVLPAGANEETAGIP